MISVFVLIDVTGLMLYRHEQINGLYLLLQSPTTWYNYSLNISAGWFIYQLIGWARWLHGGFMVYTQWGQGIETYKTIGRIFVQK